MSEYDVVACLFRESLRKSISEMMPCARNSTPFVSDLVGPCISTKAIQIKEVFLLGIGYEAKMQRPG